MSHRTGDCCHTQYNATNLITLFVYCVSDQYNTIIYFISIYLSPSLRHVSASNFGYNQVELQLYKSYRGLFFTIFFSMPLHVLYGLRGLPSWAWQKCNRLLRLGRP